MNDLPYLDLALFLPLAGALVMVLIPKRLESLLRLTAFVVTTATFVVSLGVLFSFESGNAGFQQGTELSWIPEWGIGYITGVDGVSLWMIMLTTLLMPLCILASWTIKTQVKPYFILLLTLET
nr:NADH-quinone oxidoreductase subunit M [Actinomycetota bacterium]